MEMPNRIFLVVFHIVTAVADDRPCKQRQFLFPGGQFVDTGIVLGFAVFVAEHVHLIEDRDKFTRDLSPVVCHSFEVIPRGIDG